jgi:glutamyl/glutaminyl-tRNA synthetase
MDEYEVYFTDPMHRRTVKFFRYQLEKMTETDWRAVRDALQLFMAKYEVSETDLVNPVKVVLLGTTKGPSLPKLIEYMGKEEAFKRIDQYLQDNKYRI